MSSLSLKNVKLQDPTGTLVSTLSYDGTNVTIDKPLLAPTAAAGTNNTQLATTAFAMGAGLGGSAQTLQDVKSNRSVGTTYTNSTGRPILVCPCVFINSQNDDTNLTINGVIIQRFSSTAWQGSAYVPMIGIVPNGGTYSLNSPVGGVTIQTWQELR
jgi:hypothetical protein